MELVSMAKELLQNAAEQAASFKMGQSVLRYTDRALWVVEKCARWAVPPPLDQDERPQPELVRPLPWIFFLTLLIVLRVTRESISVINLIMGKPPLRSADVVMYIQSKRRYLRTLKYQGNRIMRARGTAQAREPWYSGLKQLVDFTMCFRRSQLYGNNNTTNLSNNDEVLLTNATSPKSEQSVYSSASDQETVFLNQVTSSIHDNVVDEAQPPPEPNDSSTPTKIIDDPQTSTPNKEEQTEEPSENGSVFSPNETSSSTESANHEKKKQEMSPKTATMKFLQHEVATRKQSPPKNVKLDAEGGRRGSNLPVAHHASSNAL